MTRWTSARNHVRTTVTEAARQEGDLVATSLGHLCGSLRITVRLLGLSQHSDVVRAEQQRLNEHQEPGRTVANEPRHWGSYHGSKARAPTVNFGLIL